MNVVGSLVIGSEMLAVAHAMQDLGVDADGWEVRIPQRTVIALAIDPDEDQDRRATNRLPPAPIQPSQMFESPEQFGLRATEPRASWAVAFALASRLPQTSAMYFDVSDNEGRVVLAHYAAGGQFSHSLVITPKTLSVYNAGGSRGVPRVSSTPKQETMIDDFIAGVLNGYRLGRTAPLLDAIFDAYDGEGPFGVAPARSLERFLYDDSAPGGYRSSYEGAAQAVVTCAVCAGMVMRSETIPGRAGLVCKACASRG